MGTQGRDGDVAVMVPCGSSVTVTPLGWPSPCPLSPGLVAPLVALDRLQWQREPAGDK